MKSKLSLNAPLLVSSPAQLRRTDAAVVNSAAELERDVKENIQQSIPAGRTYRRTPIVRAESRKNAGLRLKQTRGGVISGYNFHRASAKGQPPAIDSGRLINSIRAIRIAEMKAQLNVGVDYGIYLDDPDVLDRPFFTSRIEAYRPRFIENIRRAYLGES